MSLSVKLPVLLRYFTGLSDCVGYLWPERDHCVGGLWPECHV